MKKRYWLINIFIVIVFVLFIVISNITIRRGINTDNITAVVVNEKGISPFLLLSSPEEENLTNPWGSSAINASFNSEGQLRITKYQCFNVWGWLVEGTWPVCLTINYFTPHLTSKTEIMVWNGKEYKSIGFVLIDSHQKMSFQPQRIGAMHRK